MEDRMITRRHALRLIVASVPCFVGGCAALDFLTSRQAASGRAPTAACHVTADNPAGPFYLADAPFRSRIYPDDMTGTPLRLSGVVTGVDCVTPLQDAVVDVWQANPNGEYDFSEQYVMRGRLNSDSNGFYQLETLVPGLYGSRPRHIHFMISHPQAQTLITQLYFEGDERNNTDSLVKPSLIIPLEEADSGALRGTFDIALTGV